MIRRRLTFVLAVTLGSVILSGVKPDAAAQVSINIDSSGIHVYSPALVQSYSQGMNYLQSAQGNSYATNPDLLMGLELVRASQRTLDEVLAYRAENRSWLEILGLLNVNPNYFYPSVDVREFGPPYSVAYDCYLQGGCPDYRWTDEDFLRLASVKVFSAETHRPLPEVIRVYRTHPKIAFHNNGHQPQAVMPAPPQSSGEHSKAVQKANIKAASKAAKLNRPQHPHATSPRGGHPSKGNAHANGGGGGKQKAHGKNKGGKHKR